MLEPHRDRITWDAPIHSIADIESLAFAPQHDQRQAVALRLHRRRCSPPTTTATERGIEIYGGGQSELGVGPRADPAAWPRSSIPTASTTSRPPGYDWAEFPRPACRPARSIPTPSPPAFAGGRRIKSRCRPSSARSRWRASRRWRRCRSSRRAPTRSSRPRRASAPPPRRSSAPAPPSAMDAKRSREHFRAAIAAARPQERLQLRRMAEASLALAERRPDDLKAAAEKLGQTPPTNRQLLALRFMGLVAPPPGAPLWLRARGHPADHPARRRRAARARLGDRPARLAAVRRRRLGRRRSSGASCSSASCSACCSSSAGAGRSGRATKQAEARARGRHQRPPLSSSVNPTFPPRVVGSVGSHGQHIVTRRLLMVQLDVEEAVALVDGRGGSGRPWAPGYPDDGALVAAGLRHDRGQARPRPRARSGRTRSSAAATAR